MTIPSIPCPSCGFTLKPVWFLEKELDNHGIPTGRTHKACSCLLSLRGIVGADQIVQWDTRYGEMTGKDNAICEE